MIFEIGETLVYPHHGAATITAVEMKTVKGEEKKYVTLNVHTSELVIKLPVDNAELIGVRDVIDAAGVEALYEVLQSDVVEEPANWSRRYKSNQEKMASGSVYRIGEVVRDLWRRNQGNGVSAGEKNLLQKAQKILVSELALALARDDEGASEVLEKVLATAAV